MTRPDLALMGIPLEDHHLEIRDLMLRFGAEKLAPGAAARDSSHEYPHALIDELAAMGGMAMKTGPQDDGPGLDNTGYALAIEAISRFDASVAVVMVASNLAATILAHHATDDQRARLDEVSAIPLGFPHEFISTGAGSVVYGDLGDRIERPKPRG